MEDSFYGLVGGVSAPLVIGGLVVAMVVRKIVLGLWLIAAGLILGVVVFFVSQ